MHLHLYSWFRYLWMHRNSGGKHGTLHSNPPCSRSDRRKHLSNYSIAYPIAKTVAKGTAETPSMSDTRLIYFLPDPSLANSVLNYQDWQLARSCHCDLDQDNRSQRKTIFQFSIDKESKHCEKHWGKFYYWTILIFKPSQPHRSWSLGIDDRASWPRYYVSIPLGQHHRRSGRVGRYWYGWDLPSDEGLLGGIVIQGMVVERSGKGARGSGVDWKARSTKRWLGWWGF